MDIKSEISENEHSADGNDCEIGMSHDQPLLLLRRDGAPSHPQSESTADTAVAHDPLFKNSGTPATEPKSHKEG